MLTKLIREEAYGHWQNGISRADFAYLMVTLYEEITGESVKPDGSITFEDTQDPYAIKAAHIGITNHRG